jgi:hypothetical protein
LGKNFSVQEITNPALGRETLSNQRRSRFNIAYFIVGGLLFITIDAQKGRAMIA